MKIGFGESVAEALHYVAAAMSAAGHMAAATASVAAAGNVG